MSDPEGSSSGVLLKRTGVFLAHEIECNLHVCLSCRCAASLARDVWLVVCAQPRECLFRMFTPVRRMWKNDSVRSFAVVMRFRVYTRM